MPRYDGQKNPFGQRISKYVDTKINQQLQRQSKAIPCHVVAVDKDFITVAFDTHDQTLTPPTVKIAQSFSPYAREPTQVGDKGYAVPSDYYLGGVSGNAGGQTNYYPRGNLTNLSFQPISQTSNAERNYNQYTVTGGPAGVMIIQNADKPQGSTTAQTPAGGAGTPSALSLRASGSRPQRFTRSIPGQGLYAQLAPTPLAALTSLAGNTGSSATPQGQSTTANKSNVSIDNGGTIVSQDGSSKYRATIDAPNKKTTVEAPLDGVSRVYIGGTGVEPGSIYAPIMTVRGPCAHSWGRVS